MILPDLTNAKHVTCIDSATEFFTAHTVYAVFNSGGDYYIRDDYSSDIYISGEELNMTFEVTYKDEKPDQVKNPKHYQIIEGFESITVIASVLTAEQWKGFCLGNILKYRIRAGKKGDLQQDIDKANFYEELYEKHKHLCRED